MTEGSDGQMTVSISYVVEPAEPAAHCFAVTLELTGLEREHLVLRLPAWIPGSYMIRDFARNLLELRAWSGGEPRRLQPLDKQRWRVNELRGDLKVRYRVYARERSVRAAWLDPFRAFFNGTSLFLEPEGLGDRPVLVELRPPPADACRGRWRVATALEPESVDEAGFGRYRAADYGGLIDAPVEMADFRVVDFRVRDVPHTMVLSGAGPFDEERLRRDLEAICRTQAALFGELPPKRYLFLTRVVEGEAYGGLEHRDSCALLCSADDLPLPGLRRPDEGYTRLLGLCSHEYFHLWNVQRIRPAALAGSDLQAEAYTRLLWAFEGITSYYDELMLARSGVIGPEAYLALLARNVTRLLRTPGRRHQSLAESSFFAWTRFYKQDENGPNAVVSYYVKGALVALGLDVELRLRSGDRVDLDDLMRLLWREHGRTGRPVPEEGVQALAERLLGDSLDDFFSGAVNGTDELPLERWFSALGVGFRLRPARDERDSGGLAESPSDDEVPAPWLGARWKSEGETVVLTHVLEGGPARRAGLAAEDRLVALDGVQVTDENLTRLLRRHAGQETVCVHAFREGRLHTFRLPVEAPPADTCELWLVDEADLDEAVRERRRRWLGASGGG